MVVHARYPIGEPRVQREALAARDAGWAVDVIALRHAGEATTEIVDGIAVSRLAISHKRGRGLFGLFLEYGGFALYAGVVLALRACRGRRYDVVQVHTPPDFLVLAALVPKMLGSKIVLDVHDLSSDMLGARYGQRRGSGAITAALTAIELGAGRASDTVITVHQPYANELTRHGLDRSKLAVIMNSPDDRLLKGLSRQTKPAETRPFLIAYHGTITAWYGLPLLVRALATLPVAPRPWAALILGEGDALDETKALAKDLGLAEYIEFSGRYLPIRETLARVAVADCGIVPNLPSELNRFALSSKLLEYVALEVPAVVSRLDTLSIHFSEDEVTFFEPGNPTSLAAAVEWVSANPVDAREKAARARTRFQQYAWPANGRRYVELLDTLVASPLIFQA